MSHRPPRPITPQGVHCTFGYYDRCPWDAAGRHHLAIEIPQQHGLPQPHERASVLVIDTADGDRVSSLATTSAWNHQFGALTVWLPEHQVLFNDREGDRIFSRIVDLHGREVRRLPRPIYQLAPDGRTASSMDFSRIQRRGYSYGVTNPVLGGRLLPEDDGIWLLDTATGEDRMLASYAQMAAVHPEPAEVAGRWVWSNCPMFNRDGSRLLWVFRYVTAGSSGWKTYLYSIGTDGSGLRCVLPHALWQAGSISHMEWGRTPSEILIDADFGNQGGEFTVFDDDGMPPRFTVIAPGSRGHGHQFFSPDGSRLISDTYPIAGIQHLKVVDVASGAETEIAQMRHRQLPTGADDWRCDLHPRWRGDGRMISIDSIDDGFRRVYLIELLAAR